MTCKVLNAERNTIYHSLINKAEKRAAATNTIASQIFVYKGTTNSTTFEENIE